MEPTYCKQNPSDNPYWCNIIWGYCQFQTPDTVNERCPIYHAYKDFPPPQPPYTKDVDDRFLQTYAYATIFDDGQLLVSLGDTANQMYDPGTSFTVLCPDVRYIGRYAFQDCINLTSVDFSRYRDPDNFIPVLASPEAFMMSDRTTLINASFVIKVPKSLETAWKAAPNWAALQNHIIGV